MKLRRSPRPGGTIAVVLWAVFAIGVVAATGLAFVASYRAAFQQTIAERKRVLLHDEALKGPLRPEVASQIALADYETVDPKLNTTPPPSLAADGSSPSARIAPDAAPIAAAASAPANEPVAVAVAPVAPPAPVEPAAPAMTSALTAAAAPAAVEPLAPGGGTGLIRWGAARYYTYAIVVTADRGKETDKIRLFLTYERTSDMEAGQSFAGEKSTGDGRIAFQVHGHYYQSSITNARNDHDTALKSTRASGSPLGEVDGEILLDVDGSLLRSRGGFMVDDVVGNPIDAIFEKPPPAGQPGWSWTVAGAIPRQSLFPARGQSTQQKYQLVVVVPSRYRYSSARTRARNAQVMLAPTPSAPSPAAVGTEPSTTQFTYSLSGENDQHATIAKSIQVSVGSAGGTAVMTASGNGSVIVDRPTGAPYSAKLSYGVKHHQGSVSIEVPVTVEYFLHHVSSSTAPDAADVELAGLLHACAASSDDDMALGAVGALAECAPVDSLRAGVIETIRQRLQKLEAHSRYFEVRAIGNWADASTIPMLKELAPASGQSAQLAADALKKIKDPAAMAALVDLLKTSHEGKYWFANALRDMGQPAAEPLLALLNEKDPETLKSVCEALETIYRRSSITEEKLQELSTHPNSRVRKLALDIAYSKSMVKRMAPMFQAALRDPDYENRKRADELLKRNDIIPEVSIASPYQPAATDAAASATPTPGKPAPAGTSAAAAPATPAEPVATSRPAIDEKELDKLIAVIKKNIASRDSSKRSDGFRRLQDIEPTQRHREEISKLILKVLFEKDTSSKWQASKCIEKWASQSSIPQLIKLVEMDDHSVSDSAMMALGNLRDPAGAPALITALGGRSSYRAEEAIRLMGPVAEPALIAGLANPSAKVRREVIELLGKVGGAESLKVLPPFLNDPDSSTKYAADRALKDISKRVQGGNNG